MEIYGDRAYSVDGYTFPPELKCTKEDKRTFHGCIDPRFLYPSTRVYFDSGTDSADKADLFNDGNINLTLDVVTLYFPWRMGRGEFYDNWSWGPTISAGISSASKDSKDGSEEASNAPVVLFSAGLMLEYKFSEDGPYFAFEVGRAYGFSSDESFGDNSDDATYVGLKVTIPLLKKKSVNEGK